MVILTCLTIVIDSADFAKLYFMKIFNVIRYLTGLYLLVWGGKIALKLTCLPFCGVDLDLFPENSLLMLIVWSGVIVAYVIALNGVL